MPATIPAKELSGPAGRPQKPSYWLVNADVCREIEGKETPALMTIMPALRMIDEPGYRDGQML